MKNKPKKSGYSKICKPYFIGGKQKFQFVEYMDGTLIDQWYSNNVDLNTAFQDGDEVKVAELHAQNHRPPTDRPLRTQADVDGPEDEDNNSFSIPF